MKFCPILCLTLVCAVCSADLRAVEEGPDRVNISPVDELDKLLALDLSWPPLRLDEPRTTFSFRGMGEGMTPMSFRANEYQEFGLRLQATEGLVLPFIDFGGFGCISGHIDEGMQLWAGADWQLNRRELFCMSASIQANPYVGGNGWSVNESVTLLVSYGINF